jgi:L-cysteate sulfo-lyase
VGETGGRVSLGTWPTPLEAAPRLAVALGLEPADLWLKRDDLTGLGGGGNKVRKLERLCGAALARGATALVTTGAAQSNHARLTAAAGARLGLDVHLVLAGSGPPGEPAGNLVLDGLLGAALHWGGAMDVPRLEARAAALAADLEAAGAVVEVVPYGGTSVASAAGYVDAAEELVVQLPDVRHAVVAVGSGGTMAGLVAGLGADRVLGVATGALAEPDPVVSELVAGLTGEAPGRLRLRSDLVGAGYSELVPAVADAMRLAARCEGLVLDPVYTGRALAGLAAEIADGAIRPGERTVLVHTGGLPGLFGHTALGELAT